MAQSSAFNSLGGVWKYAVIFVALLVAAAGAGGGRVLWLRRRNRRIRAEEHDTTNGARGPADLRSEKQSEGDLFGIRALEAGYTGGIAQSKPQLRVEAQPVSPGPSQVSYVLDSPPRRPPHARSSSSGSKSKLNFKLQPAPKKRTESPKPVPRPSTSHGSRPGTPTMWFHSQQDAQVPQSWYLPTSGEIFGNGPRNSSPKPSARLNLRSRASAKSSLSDSSSGRGREKLQPSGAELTGRINHSSLANVIINSSDDSTTQQTSNGTATVTTIVESQTSSPSTPRSPLPALSLFPKTEEPRRPTTPRTPKSFQFDLETAVEKQPTRLVTKPEPVAQLNAPSSNLRPLSSQNENFSHTPPQSRLPNSAEPQDHESDDHKPRTRVESQIIDSYYNSKKRRSVSSMNDHVTYSPNRSEESTASRYSEDTLRDFPRAPSTAPYITVDVLDVPLVSPFDPFFSSELTPPLSPNEEGTILKPTVYKRLPSHSNRPPSPDHLSPRHRRSLSASTFSSFNTSASLHDRSHSPEPDTNQFTYASAQQARFSKEAPRLSIIRRSITASPTSPLSPGSRLSRMGSLTPTKEDENTGDAFVWRTNSMKVVTVAE